MPDIPSPPSTDPLTLRHQGGSLSSRKGVHLSKEDRLCSTPNSTTSQLPGPLVIRKHTLYGFNLLKFIEVYFIVQNLVHLDEFSMCVLLLLSGMFCKCQSGKVNDDVFQVLCVVTDFLLVGGGGCDASGCFCCAGIQSPVSQSDAHLGAAPKRFCRCDYRP